MDAQALFKQASCFFCYGANSSDGLELAMLQSVAQNGIVTGNFRITEVSDVRTTEAGDSRVVQ